VEIRKEQETYLLSNLQDFASVQVVLWELGYHQRYLNHKYDNICTFNRLFSHLHDNVKLSLSKFRKGIWHWKHEKVQPGDCRLICKVKNLAWKAVVKILISWLGYCIKKVAGTSVWKSGPVLGLHDVTCAVCFSNLYFVRTVKFFSLCGLQYQQAVVLKQLWFFPP
jgi:hypothetical protein